MGERVSVSLVLPAYNEEATIEATVRETLATLDAFLPDGTYEVLIAEDGCEDGTPEIATRLAAEDPRVRHIHSDERLGRGRALEDAFEHASGDTLVYMDSDLATDLDHLEELVEAVRTDGYHVATGSRWMHGHVADRPPKRKLASRGFNGLVRTFLPSKLQDHQCGFKAFHRDAFEALKHEVEDGHWFWDTEMLVRAQQMGFAVKEFPVRWTPMADTKVDLVNDVVGMGLSIFRCWWGLPSTKRTRQRMQVPMGVLLIVAAFGLMFTYLDPREVLAGIMAIDPLWVAGAAALYALSWPLRGHRYERILDELGHEEGVGFLTGSIFVSQTGNMILPARTGDSLRAYMLNRRRAIPYGSGFASLAVERIFDLLILTGLAALTFALSPLIVGDQLSGLLGGLEGGALASARIGLAVAAGVGLVTLAIVAWIARSARREEVPLAGLIDRMPRQGAFRPITSGVERFARDLTPIAGRPRAFASVAGLSALIWTIDIVTAVMVLAAFHVTVGLPLLLALGIFAVSLGNLAKVLPLSPGGIGLYEGVFAGLFVAVTPIGWSVAVGAAIVDHGIKNTVTLVGGTATLMGFNTSLVEMVRDADASQDAPTTERA